MESPNSPHVMGLKRKLIESCGTATCKITRVSTDHGQVFHSCAHGYHSCPVRPTVADSCFNYLNSSTPRRVMFHSRGEWLDFSGPELQMLIKGFKDKKSSITFSMGGQALLLDFLSMVLINLRTRKQRSVAWIDDTDKCFFPTFFFDEEANESTELVSGITKSKPQEAEVAMACSSPPEVVKRVVMESGVLVSTRVSTLAKAVSTKIETLGHKTEDFLFVQNLLLSGMGPFAKSLNIVHIHKCAQKDTSTRARMDAFESQIRFTKAERGGDANVQYGWYGLKKTDLVGILIDGFGKAGKPTEKGAFGTGIYFTPESRALSSVNLCDVDEKGIQYMMLCRIILGNAEQVQPRSKQYLPSSQDFDSGVDNLLSPKCYVVWPTHANSYIHPEYIISFMLASRIQEYLCSLKDVRFHVPAPRVVQDFSTIRSVRYEPVKAPISPWMSFTMLFEEIQDSVSPLAMELLFDHHDELKRKIITREELVKKIRLIVGDQLLVSTLKRLQRSPSLWSDVFGPQEIELANSNARRTKLDAYVSSRTDPNESAAMKFSDNAAPVIDLNDSVSPSKMDPNESNALALKPYSSWVPKNDHGSATN